jgi:hypothetical protein
LLLVIFCYSDPTPKEFISWFNYFYEEVEKEVVVYFSGYSKTTVDYDYSEEGEAEDVLVLYNESRKKIETRGGFGGVKKRSTAIEAGKGITEDSISVGFYILFFNYYYV